MDVNDVKNVESRTLERTSVQSASRQRHSSSLASSKVAGVSRDSVRLDVSHRGGPERGTELRAKANEVISVINVASEATSDIERLARSIDGILEQADTEELGQPSLNILQGEANQLVEEISRRSGVLANGLRPLAGDEIRFEIEERLGKTLEVLLPTGAAEAFGMGEIRLTPKEAILDVRTAIAMGRRRIEHLRDAIESAKQDIGRTVAEVDVALQNTEASEASIRDVDEALRIAGQTRVGIYQNPVSALNSVGQLNQQALSLLD